MANCKTYPFNRHLGDTATCSVKYPVGCKAQIPMPGLIIGRALQKHSFLGPIPDILSLQIQGETKASSLSFSLPLSSLWILVILVTETSALGYTKENQE